MSPESSTSLPAAEESRVQRASLVRGLAVVALWLVTWPLRPSGEEIRLGLDIVLALAGWWAMLPGRRAGGKLFGEHGHWSSLVVALPIGFAIAAAAELWHMVRGGG
jgi:hypothetical protein